MPARAGVAGPGRRVVGGYPKSWPQTGKPAPGSAQAPRGPFGPVLSVMTRPEGATRPVGEQARPARRLQQHQSHPRGGL